MKKGSLYDRSRKLTSSPNSFCCTAISFIFSTSALISPLQEEAICALISQSSAITSSLMSSLILTVTSLFFWRDNFVQSDEQIRQIFLYRLPYNINVGHTGSPHEPVPRRESTDSDLAGCADQLYALTKARTVPVLYRINEKNRAHGQTRILPKHRYR